MLFKVLLMVTTAFLAPQVDTADEPEVKAAKSCVYVVKTCGEGEPGQAKVVVCGDPGSAPQDGATSHVWVSKNCGDGEPGQANVFYFGGPDAKSDGKVCITTCAVNAAGGIEAGGPWLGIQFGPVPKPLASHLGIDDDLCLMILNVVEDSPADQAGLKQYDVIVNVKGGDVPGDVGEFLDIVRSFEPGDTPIFSLIRNGESVQATVTVGTRPESQAATTFKYDLPIEELSKDKVFNHGGFLCKDEDGNWSMKGIDNFQMHPKLKCFMNPGEGGDLEFKMDMLLDCLPGHGLNVIVEKGQHGDTLKIERADDQITVTRTTTAEDGTETTTTEVYDGEDAVKASDPEAYEQLQACGGNLAFMNSDGSHISLQSLGDAEVWMKDFHGDINIDLDDVLKNVHMAHGQASENYEKAIKQFGGQLKKLHDGHHSFDIRMLNKASISFEVESDGKIRVSTRNGDEELVQVFDDVNELEKLRPDLFKKYNKLQATSKTATLKE